jgi:hypothetical protein
MHGGSELWKVPLFSCSSTFHSYSFHASFRPLCMNTVPQLGGDGAQRESRRRRRRRRHTHTTADRRSLRTLPLPPALHKKTRGTGEGQPICTRSIRVALKAIFSTVCSVYSLSQNRWSFHGRHPLPQIKK